MRVLITGVTGFVGRHLAELCQRSGAEVIGLARRTPAGDLDALLDDSVVVDLLDERATLDAVRAAAPDRVFHLAADASVARSWREPRHTLEANILVTSNLLEAVRREAPAASVLLAGSGEVYGAAVEDQLPLRETAPPRPRNPYALSKATVDLMGAFYRDAHELRVINTRAFNHAGPGQSETYVVASFARQIAAAEADGRPSVLLETGDVRPRRDFTDVRDVVEAYWEVVEGGDAGLYNVCSGESTAIADILAGLAAHSPIEVGQRTNRTLVREHEVMEIRGSHEKLTGATGWRPRIPLERTLSDTLDWWRARLGVEAPR